MARGHMSQILSGWVSQVSFHQMGILSSTAAQRPVFYNCWVVSMVKRAAPWFQSGFCINSSISRNSKGWMALTGTPNLYLTMVLASPTHVWRKCQEEMWADLGFSTKHTACMTTLCHSLAVGQSPVGQVSSPSLSLTVLIYEMGMMDT